MKKHNLDDFIDIFEKNQKLPHSSQRKFFGFFLNFLRKVFSPFFEFFLGARIETQRKANLEILYKLKELENKINMINEKLEEVKSFSLDLKKSMEELQKETLHIRDEKIPALKDALSIGLEGVDRKAEWGLSNLISIKEMLSKGVSLTEEERASLKKSLTSLNFLLKFRGREEEISKRQKIYIEKIKGVKRIVDLGCGRGEFLELLKENNIEGFGVEKEPSLCAILKEKELQFFEMDIFDFLEKKPIEFDGISCFHLIEHLNLKEGLSFLKLVYENLPEGGIFLIETPNPTSLFSFLNFFKDPEHKTPWHPETLKFFAKEIGFEIMEEIYLEEIKGIGDLNLPQETRKLLYGPQDYGIILKKP